MYHNIFMSKTLLAKSKLVTFLTDSFNYFNCIILAQVIVQIYPTTNPFFWCHMRHEGPRGGPGRMRQTSRMRFIRRW